jgi:hypothetical protein
MVSEAEERRLKFLEAKKTAGGSAKDLMKQIEAKPYTVYFDDAGSILCVTKEDITPEATWTNSHTFTWEQVRILEGKNTNLFYVKKDQFVDNLYSIESRPTEKIHVSADNDFLYLIPENVSSADITCSLSSTEFTVTLSEKILEKYSSIDKSQIAINGKKILKFFLTAKNDPHFMFTTISVALPNLVEKKSISFNLPNDYSQCSIYTSKVFDKYVRT